jgi:hypothetical protein
MNDIRERLQETAAMIQTRLPPNTMFVLLAGDFGPGTLEYISNGRREDVVKLLKEFIKKTEGERWMRHCDEGPQAPT